jgi:hypothetical protein
MSAGARLGHSDFVLIIFPVIAPILFNILCCAFYARFDGSYASAPLMSAV